jgi:predicted transcriptional regulator
MDIKNCMPEQEGPILFLIQQIKDGILNPKTLSKDIRQRCVEFLLYEGYTEMQVAQILMRSDKTVSRDLAEIRERNAIAPNINLAQQIIGDMLQKSTVHHKYLMRLARSPEASTSEKSQSEFLAWRVLKEAIEKMQSLGYLPLKPQEIVEDIFHHGADADNEKSIEEVKSAISDIEQAAKDTGTLDAATEKNIAALKSKILRAEISHEVNELAEKKNKLDDKQEVKNEE